MESKEDIPVIQVGKNGVTEQLIVEIKKYLKKNRTLKVRILKSAYSEREDKKKIAEDVSAKCKVKLVDLRGNTFIITRNK